jgi:NAD(P)-dependent dehydrogenase (short-subunit alcohol dehydrogenase family)
MPRIIFVFIRDIRSFVSFAMKIRVRFSTCTVAKCCKRKKMNKQLSGKVAVVTGGTQGLGEATARLFAARGAAGLITCGRSLERGDAIARELTASGCPTRFVRADLSQVDDCFAVLTEADRVFGRVDILVNAAGITDRGTLLDTTPELFDRLFAVNVRGPFFLMQETAHIMRREGIAGAMVNVLSMAAHGGQPFITAYSGSKGALAVMTKNAAFSLLRDRIRVNALNIGWMDTPGEDHTQRYSDGKEDNWLVEAESAQPFKRLLKPEEVARTIAFLSSEESGMMTGSIIDFDQSVLGCYDSPPHPAA